MNTETIQVNYGDFQQLLKITELLIEAVNIDKKTKEHLKERIKKISGAELERFSLRLNGLNADVDNYFIEHRGII